jgi:phosphoadenosine phosphosulfate reductase
MTGSRTLHGQMTVEANSQDFGLFPLDTQNLDHELARKTASQRVEWLLERFPYNTVLTSSFGAQAAVCLHLVSQLRPDIPVVLIDTGYLFPETYQFVDELSERLALNLKVFRPEKSPSWQETRVGRLWEQGLPGIESHNRFCKIEPMNRALEALDAKAWITGIRRQQSNCRAKAPVLLLRNGRLKLHPIVDWTDRDVHGYLKHHQLPYHPLWHQGYVSIGDTHTSRPLQSGLSAEESRFFGIKRECGLHEEV